MSNPCVVTKGGLTKQKWERGAGSLNQYHASHHPSLQKSTWVFSCSAACLSPLWKVLLQFAPLPGSSSLPASLSCRGQEMSQRQQIVRGEEPADVCVRLVHTGHLCQGSLSLSLSLSWCHCGGSTTTLGFNTRNVHWVQLQSRLQSVPRIHTVEILVPVSVVWV